jgi:hypothetical protein
MVWSEGDMSLKNAMTAPGIDPGTVRLVAQRLNHYATPDPNFIVILYFKQNGMSSTKKYKRNSKLLGEGKRVRMVVSGEPVGWKVRNSLEEIAVNQLRWYKEHNTADLNVFVG